jgi:putative hydrolase of the HAD superfamily
MKRAVIFDLFHTLTSLESTWGAGRLMTHQVLGVRKEAWEEQLLRKSRDRLVGLQTDAFQIVAEMAHAIDPAIPDERIKAATENRIARFAAALREIPDETSAVLECLKSRGKRLGLISNADVMEVAAWADSRLRHWFDSTCMRTGLRCSVVGGRCSGLHRGSLSVMSGPAGGARNIGVQDE